MVKNIRHLPMIRQAHDLLMNLRHVCSLNLIVQCSCIRFLSHYKKMAKMLDLYECFMMSIVLKLSVYTSNYVFLLRMSGLFGFIMAILLKMSCLRRYLCQMMHILYLLMMNWLCIDLLTLNIVLSGLSTRGRQLFIWDLVPIYNIMMY